MSNFAHLDNTTGRKPGVNDTFYFAPLSWFRTVQTPPYPGTPYDPNENPITIYQSHIFDTDKAFLIAKAAHRTALFEIISQGLPGAASFLNEFSAFHPGNYDVQHDVIKDILNDELIILVKQAHCDDDIVHQLGSSCLPARITEAKYGSGTIDGQERKGYQLKFSADMATPTLYRGDIVTKPKVPLSFGSYSGPNHDTNVAGTVYNMGINIIGTMPMWIMPGSTWPAGWQVTISGNQILISSVTPTPAGPNAINLYLSNGVSPTLFHQFHINVV